MSNQHLAKSKELINDVTEAQVKLVNVTLLKETPESLVIGLEALVGLLRDAKKANNIDVELFFEEFSKFSNKLKRMEAGGLKLANVAAHTATMREIKPKFDAVFDSKAPKSEEDKDQMDLRPFASLIEWGIEFGSSAEIILKRDALEKEIIDLQKKRVQCELLKDRISQVQIDTKEVGMMEHYDEHEADIAKNKVTVDNIANTDQMQASKYQEILFKFEKNYFARLEEAYKQQPPTEE